ncbi:hypothetical protein CPB84DRAFT_1766090 [Gymnopilus junonius]|uniref:Uncharacterized protein n=1 Tax=Gymnopilus junonius TaxID=109634 RepID=A0A9P5NZ68_GYMJU|nr:hypothetical protein CPB84DRAFT_1766090 [Gymnopilus junonius]
MTDWILIMDDSGLRDLPQSARTTLLHPPSLFLPFGPKGVLLPIYHSTQDPQLGQIFSAEYVIPPFVTPSPLLSSFVAGSGTLEYSSWADFGHHTATHFSDTTGGILFQVESRVLPHSVNLIGSKSVSPMAAPPGPLRTQFVFFLPTREDLRRAAPLICAMQGTEEKQLKVLIYDDIPKQAAQQDFEEASLQGSRCIVKYDFLTGRTSLSFTREGSAILSGWLDNQRVSVDVVMSVKEMDPLIGFLRSELNHPSFHDATVILIPRKDLDHIEWMSSLSLEEWKSWHTPQIVVSVITKDRPQSLLRLFESLSNARYFGDSLDLRINVEQDCDTETLDVAANMIWPIGRVFLHRRIIHADLLPAVLESWYPQSNDSYGVLLEDDVEVSPLFYAWIKMTILRYRYGDSNDKIPALFGVSLYQQKHLELPLEGRRPFNPRSFFSVPCSWGAVYFPDHWREFHDYLSFRFAESVFTLEDNVVEGVRSNHWLKSWKRYFIELVYLRGYVMLYPNYEDFLSLSTNHLEVGSHVKVRSSEREDLFSLPLMQLQEPQEMCKLLDLPNRRLPHVELLPVLNLTGSLTSLEEIIQRGESRRLDIMQCDRHAELHGIRSLMCSPKASGPFSQL